MLARYLKAFEAEGGQPAGSERLVGFFDLHRAAQAEGSRAIVFIVG